MVGHFETRKDRPAVGRVTIENRDETVRLTISDSFSAVAVVNLYPDAALKLAAELLEVMRARLLPLAARGLLRLGQAPRRLWL